MVLELNSASLAQIRLKHATYLSSDYFELSPIHFSMNSFLFLIKFCSKVLGQY